MSEQQDKSALPVGTIAHGHRLLGLLDVLGIGGFGVTYMVEDSETAGWNPPGTVARPYRHRGWAVR